MRSRVGRLAPRGLRWRLAGWVALVTLLCTGIAFVAVYRGTGTQLRNQVDRELRVYAGELSHDVVRADAGPESDWRRQRRATCSISRSTPGRRSCS